jgi:hypothetical protein
MRLFGALGSGEIKEFRVVTIGWDRMARKARMSDKAAKRNLTGLIAKLAVELVREEDSARRIGRTYRIFSYTEILERRKAAGLMYVVRDKGVRFVTADGRQLPNGQNARPDFECKTPTVDVSTTVDKISPVSVDVTSPVSVDVTSPVSVDVTSPVSVDVSSPPLGSYLDNSLGNTSSTSEDEEQVLAAFAAYSVADRRAPAQLIRSCRSACPDVKVHEITALIHEKAAIMRISGKVVNPVGFLLTVVPLCCEPQALREFRRRQQVAADLDRQKTAIAKEREHEEIRTVRRYYRDYLAVLKNPSATAPQIQRANECIADLKRWFRDAGITPDE